MHLKINFLEEDFIQVKVFNFHRLSLIQNNLVQKFQNGNHFGNKKEKQKKTKKESLSIKLKK